MPTFEIVHSPEGQFVAFCWGVLVVVWIIDALFTKRTVERSSSFWRAILVVAVLGFFASRADHLPHLADFVLWPYSQAVGRIADIVAAVGLLIALWARFTLGANWSGTITFKQNHELITSGPYAFVRHPIYTGFLLLMLANAILYGHAFGFAALAILTLSLWLKAREEEKMMMKHFPDAYPNYKAHVKGLVPFVF